MTVAQYAAGTGVIIGILVFRRLFAKTVISRLEKITSSTKNKFDDKLLDALENPLKFIPVVVGVFFFTEYFNLTQDTKDTMLSIGRSLTTFLVFWVVYNIVKPLGVYIEKFLASITKKSEADAGEFSNLLIKTLQVATIIVGFISILAQWGVNILPILGSLGVVGMGVAIAAKDTIANVFGGVKLLFDGTFRSGHWIETPSIEGTVMEIGIATTKLRAFDKSIISVPNNILANQSIKNWSKMSNRRIKMNIGLEYRVTRQQTETVLKRLRDYLKNHPDIANPKESPVAQMVHLVEFADSSININLYYFTKTINWERWRELREENMLAFMRIMEEENVGFAFPSQSIYVESMPD